MGAPQSLKTVCRSCSLEAQKVESVLEERLYGEMFAVFITERIFHHVAEDGGKKICRERMPHPWLFTLCHMDEIERVRQLVRDEAAKFAITAGMVLS